MGKSTLAFNLTYELAQWHSCLLLDTCSQRNFSQTIFGDDVLRMKDTIYDALVREMAGGGTVNYKDLARLISPFCSAFRMAKPCYMVPGSPELFAIPSLMYSQLAQFAQLTGQHKKETSARIVLAIKRIIDGVLRYTRSEKVIIDTSPFFGGATHLSWAAVEALVVPVRVDQHSIEALNLTLDMLQRQEMDFLRANEQAGLTHVPKVHAIAMTHCGWSRQKEFTPDSATKLFIEKAIKLSQQYASLFSEPKVEQCFYILDDFHSSGRISGKQRIPLSDLESGQKFVVEGQRLEVNPSVERYQKEIRHLAAAL